MHRSLSSFADSQERILEAFWQDTQPPAPPPVPYRGLLESLQVATAALSSEREDIAASQRLAERFAREPAQAPWQPPVRRQAPAIRPYMVAVALMILIGGGSAVYFLESGALPKRAPDGTARAAAIAPTNEDSLDSLDERDAPASRAFIPSQPIARQDVLAEQGGGEAAPASDRAADDSWASAVESLRQLSNAKNTSQQAKAGQPNNAQQMLHQLETWRKADKAR